MKTFFAVVLAVLIGQVSFAHAKFNLITKQYSGPFKVTVYMKNGKTFTFRRSATKKSGQVITIIDLYGKDISKVTFRPRGRLPFTIRVRSNWGHVYYKPN